MHRHILKSLDFVVYLDIKSQEVTKEKPEVY